MAETLLPSFLVLQHPNFDQVAFSIWIFDIRWYALAYIAGPFGVLSVTFGHYH